MRRPVYPFLMILALLATPMPARSAETPLASISDQASLVIRLKSPETTIGKIADLANQVQPGTGDLLRARSQGLGILISNPTLAGVDQKRDWLVAAFARAEGEPGVLFVIPATDTDALRNAVGDSFHSVTRASSDSKDNWVLYSDDEGTAKDAEKFLKAGGSSVAATMGEKSQSVFDAGDVSVFVNAKQLKIVYADQIDKARKKLDEVLDQMSQLPIEAPGMDLKAVWDMYRDLGKGFLQGVDDSENFTIALSVTRAGLTIEEYLRVEADSKTDQFLQSHPTSELESIQRLPAGHLGYMAGHGNVKAIGHWGMDFSKRMYGGNEKLSKVFDEAEKMFDELKFGDMAAVFKLGNLEDGALQAVSIVDVTPTDKMRDLSREFMQGFGTIEIAGLTQEYKIQTDAEKYGAHSADLITVKTEVDEKMDPMGVQKKMMDVLYGPGGMTMRYVYMKDRIVQGFGKDATVLTDVVKALDAPSPTSSEAEHLATRQQLLPKANLVVLFDLPGCALKVAKLVVDSGQIPIPITPDMLAGLNVPPSYLGFSLAAEPQGLRAKTFVPTQQFQGIAQLAMFGQQLWMQKNLEQ